MADIIILVLVAVLLVFAARGTVKHFKGEGPCCGGGSGSASPVIEEKRLENPVLGKKTVYISGMHCEHCVQSVTKAINRIDGACAKVELKKNRAVVSYDRELDEAALRKAVEDAGFKVTSVVEGQRAR